MMRHDQRRGWNVPVLLVIVLSATPPAFAGKGKSCVPCPLPESIEKKPSEVQPAPAEPTEPSLLSTMAAAPAPESVAPGMLGDSWSYPQHVVGFNRFKIAEGQTVLPMGRVSTLYSYFQDVGPKGAANQVFGYNQHRLGVSIEHPFFERLVSVQIRAFADKEQEGTIVGTDGDWDPGDMFIAFKGLLYQNGPLAITGGFGINIPTGERPPLLPRVPTIQPFLGYLLTPNDQLFVHGFVATDIATQADDVSFLLLDSAVGYWVHRNPGAGISGLAPTIEIHVAMPISNASGIYNLETTFIGFTPLFTVGSVAEDVINLTSGLTVEIRDNATLQLGVSVPVSSDRQFTTEGIAQFHIAY